MTRAQYDEMVAKNGITVERIRQIQRGALALIREGSTGVDMVALWA